MSLATFAIGLGALGHRARSHGARVTPNVGIWRTARSAFSVGTATFVVTTLGFAVSYGLRYGACVGLTTATITALWFGGVDVLHHVVLRALLHLRGALALDAASVLDRLVEVGLMRRAGNGYMFMHAMLLRHLAKRGS